METFLIINHSEDNSIIECLQFNESHSFLITAARLVPSLIMYVVVLFDFNTVHVGQGT